jgi:hypothetical protein
MKSRRETALAGMVAVASMVLSVVATAEAGEWRCIGLEEDSVTFINGKLSGRLRVGASSGMYVYNDTSWHQAISGRPVTCLHGDFVGAERVSGGGGELLLLKGLSGAPYYEIDRSLVDLSDVPRHLAGAYSFDLPPEAFRVFVMSGSVTLRTGLFDPINHGQTLSLSRVRTMENPFGVERPIGTGLLEAGESVRACGYDRGHDFFPDPGPGWLMRSVGVTDSMTSVKQLNATAMTMVWYRLPRSLAVATVDSGIQIAIYDDDADDPTWRQLVLPGRQPVRAMVGVPYQGEPYAEHLWVADADGVHQQCFSADTCTWREVGDIPYPAYILCTQQIGITPDSVRVYAGTAHGVYLYDEEATAREPRATVRQTLVRAFESKFDVLRALDGGREITVRRVNGRMVRITSRRQLNALTPGLYVVHVGSGDTRAAMSEGRTMMLP